MALYHAGKYNAPLCGTRGNGNRYGVIVLAPKEWNALDVASRCTKCVAKIQQRNQANKTSA